MKNNISVDELKENISTMGVYILLFNLREEKNKVSISCTYKNRTKNPKKLSFINKIIKPTKKQIKNDEQNLRKIFFKKRTKFFFLNESKTSAQFKLYIDVESIDVLLKKLKNTIDKAMFKMYGPGNTKKYYHKLFFALFFVNGSFDFERKWISVDLPRYIIEYKTWFNLEDMILMIFDNLDVVDLNVRWSQPEGEKRKDQLRVSLKWFYDNFRNSKYFSYFSYKQDYFERVIWGLRINNMNIDTFLYKKSQNKWMINFDGNWRGSGQVNIEETTNAKRNQGLINKIKKYQEDRCFGCFWILEKWGFYYKLRTFKYNDGMKSRNRKDWVKSRHYYEIHHVISFANKKTDKFENLVKLCVVCHAALTKKRSKPQKAKRIIKRIIKRNPASKKFAIKYLESNSNKPNNLIDGIYNSLK